MADDGSGVNVRNYRDFKFFQILVSHLLRTPVRTDGRKLAHHQALDVRVRGLVIVRVGAVVANFWIRQDNDLPGIRRIGENFLVAGNGGIKNDFAVTLAFCSVASAAEDSAVFQRKDGVHSRSRGWILQILSSAADE